jgi:hypothetical protein
LRKAFPDASKALPRYNFPWNVLDCPGGVGKGFFACQDLSFIRSIQLVFFSVATDDHKQKSLLFPEQAYYG